MSKSPGSSRYRGSAMRRKGKDEQQKRTPNKGVVAFSYASEVSCRAWAEKAGPTTIVDDSPLKWFPRCTLPVHSAISYIVVSFLADSIH